MEYFYIWVCYNSKIKIVQLFSMSGFTFWTTVNNSVMKVICI